MGNEKNVKEILTIIYNVKYGETISIGEITENLDMEKENAMKLMAMMFKLNYFLVDGKFSFSESANLQTHHRVTLLDREGIYALQLLQNEELLQIIKEKHPYLNNSVFLMIEYWKSYCK